MCLNNLVAHNDMVAALATGAGHPVVAGLLGLGAVGLAAVVVAMAWSVHVRQIRLAEQLARKQFIVTGDADPAHANGAGDAAAALLAEAEQAADPAATSRVIVDGPETVVVGEQVRYRVRPNGTRKTASWAVGGGSVAQAPDPAHPDELLLIADQPGDLIVTARVREGMMERRGTKQITAVEDVTNTSPPFTLRLCLHGWGLITVGVLIVGFTGALVALGTLAAADFLALVASVGAVLGVVAVALGGDSGGGAGSSPGPARPRP
jgi:hypothetical protein